MTPHAEKGPCPTRRHKWPCVCAAVAAARRSRAEGPGAPERRGGAPGVGGREPAQPAGASDTPLFPGDEPSDRAKTPDSTPRARPGMVAPRDGAALDCEHYGRRTCPDSAPCVTCWQAEWRRRGHLVPGDPAEYVRQEYKGDPAPPPKTARQKLLTLRAQARAEWRRTLACAPPGDARERALHVLDLCTAAGIPARLATPASMAAWLVGGPDEAAHPMDGSWAFGVRAAIAWLHAREPREAERLSNYWRGIHE